MIRGLRTSEFWAAVVAAGADLLSKQLHVPVTAAALMSGLAGLYVLGRSVVKWAEAKNPAIALDAEKIQRSVDYSLAKIREFEDKIQATPALSAEQAAVVAKLEKVGPVADALTKLHDVGLIAPVTVAPVTSVPAILAGEPDRPGAAVSPGGAA